MLTETTNYTKQANEFLQKHGIKFSSSYLGHKSHFEDDKKSNTYRDVYRCTFKRDNKRFSVTFGQSINNRGKEPRAYDVLTCIQKYEPENFEDFCNEFGYNERPLSDYPSVKRIHKAVVKEWEKVNNFFTSEELEELQEIN